LTDHGIFDIRISKSEQDVEMKEKLVRDNYWWWNTRERLVHR